MSGSTDQEFRAKVAMERDSTRDVMIAFLSVISITFGLELYNAFIFRRETISKNKVARQTIYSLLAMTFLAVIYFINNVVVYTKLFPESAVECDVWVRLGLIVVYLFTKQFIYIFLFVRMKISHNAMNLNSMLNKLTRWTVWLNVTLGVPFVFVPLGVIFYGGSDSLEGYCIQYHTQRFPVIFFVIADTLLNMTVTYLFVAPLLHHKYNMDNVVGGHNKMDQAYRVARSNLFFSTIMSAMTLTSLTHQAIYGDIARPEDERISTQLLASVDLFVGFVCCHLMTFIWFPTNKYKNTSVTDNGALSPRASKDNNKLSKNPANQLSASSSTNDAS